LGSPIIQRQMTIEAERCSLFGKQGTQSLDQGRVFSDGGHRNSSVNSHFKPFVFNQASATAHTFSPSLPSNLIYASFRAAKIVAGLVSFGFRFQKEKPKGKGDIQKGKGKGEKEKGTSSFFPV
jgi:hypothetical protein